MNILDTLDIGVMTLTAELAVEYANARWTQWLHGAPKAGTLFRMLLDEGMGNVEGELRSVLEDSEPRTIRFALKRESVDTPPRRLCCLVRRSGRGLVLEARVEADEEGASMHDIARRLAEVVDMDEVLQTLCEITTRQCGGSGAAVLRVSDARGEVVAAAGDLIPARGSTFDLENSLLRTALTENRIVREENFSQSNRPLARVVPNLVVGPLMVAPLRAHGESLGVLAVSRGTGKRPFRSRETERLRVIANHASLAVHKSLLLMQAQSADRAKGRFLATMSHELRTPLTALTGYNELLADQVIGPLSEPQLDILERMRSVTVHLSAMIEEILAFSSLEEGREVVRPTEFLAADLVRAAIAVVEPMAEAKALRLNVSVPRKAVRMVGDIDKSRQILVNLLGNAIKFTERGSVSLTLKAQGEGVRMEVEDTGIGIATEELSRLFKPFAQIDTGLTRRYGGTGLGLYISRRIASMLHGHIEVSSAEGVGSKFVVALPTHWRPTLTG